MAVIFVPDREGDIPDIRWKNAFERHLPNLSFCQWPIQKKAPEIKYAIVWKPPEKIWRFLPNLEAVFVLGAGVDSVLQGGRIPNEVRIVRIVDGGMARPMSFYALHACLFFQGGFQKYRENQLSGTWEVFDYSPPEKFPVGVMGVGVIGHQVANTLLENGFPVIGWARTKKINRKYKVFTGKEELNLFLSNLKILINVLPYTKSTRGILNSKTLYQVPRGSFLINIGRGEAIVENDLVAAIECEHICGAFLDVFLNEPLPPDHPFFHNKSIFITPHIAAPTFVEEAIEQIISNIKLMNSGQNPIGLVDKQQGY